MNNGNIDQRAHIMRCLKELKLAGMRECLHETGQSAEQENFGYEEYLLTLLEHECEIRRNNRVARFLKQSGLPLEKTMDSFDIKRLPMRQRQQMATLCEGGFLDRKENVLVFGNPGSGKTHLLCAIAHNLIQQGKRVLFVPCVIIVQQLLAAKKNLTLPNKLKRISKYDAILLDDIGYVQHSREEMEVLFTLLADRYERSSIMLTSNLPFSGWEAIFKDPMVTAAAIDRLVHHSIIIELNLESYRMAERLKKEKEVEKGNYL